MPIIQAQVPQAHLATAMGNPNQLLLEYSTNILLPVPGPYLITQLRRNFMNSLLDLNDFMAFAEDAVSFLDTGETINFVPPTSDIISSRWDDATRYNRVMMSAALETIKLGQRGTWEIREPGSEIVAGEDRIPMRESLLIRLSSSNFIYREMFDAKIIVNSPKLLKKRFRNTQSFDERCALVLKPLIENRRANVPNGVTNLMTDIFDQALDEAKEVYPSFLHSKFKSISVPTKQSLILWLSAAHLAGTPTVANPFLVDLTNVIGFNPVYFVREWALNRRERLQLVFGTPELRGPIAAESVSPSGMYRREDYSASQTEFALMATESSRTTTIEGLTLGSRQLRRELNSLYYSGGGTLNQLTDQAANSHLTEERRSVVLSMIREVSESRENSTINISLQNTATTITREAPGVDPKLSATHHRFKVVVPIDATVEMYDVGLTWSPRIFNPFFGLRKAIRNTYDQAMGSHLLQYYVPEPVTPPIVFEKYMLDANLYLESKDDHHRVVGQFTIQHQITNRQDRADLANAYAEFEQDRGFWRNDSDQWVVGLIIDSYVGGTIRGRVFVEMEDEDKWQGYVYVYVPILRYSQETVNALANFEIEMRDYELKRQALEAQAHQIAHIKQREFIERHERLEDLQKIVFEALIRRVCLFSFSSLISYYKEIISRCIDWNNAKIEFEAAPLDSLEFPDFPADHFVNSPAVRFFLPIIRNAEVALFDALTACGSFQVQASVDSARARIDGVRNKLQANGPTQLDQFSTEMIIGEHVEAVMSEHDHST